MHGGVQRDRNVSSSGGWGAQRGNVKMASNDHIGGVLSAFGQALRQDEVGLLPDDIDDDIRESRRLGAEWLLDMQNPDGGWSAFIWGMPAKPRGPLMKAPVSSTTTLMGTLRFMSDPPVELGEDPKGSRCADSAPKDLGALYIIDWRERPCLLPATRRPLYRVPCPLPSRPFPAEVCIDGTVPGPVLAAVARRWDCPP